MGDKSSSIDENAKIKHLVQVDKKSLPPDGGPEYNRLIFARSPYLLQHAENPVDWYQWGDEAFTKAKRENKPVFLSIGYATCHWCHVMERESFEDKDVADVLNRYFVSIKVDREERPDVDDQYMTAAQLMEGGGGWPLNMFLDNDGKPFYSVAYIPKTSRQGTPGFVELLEKIADVWKSQRDVVETSCAEIIRNLAERFEPAAAPIPGREILEKTWQHLETAYDRDWGGFGTAPKFPRPLFLSYLLRFWNRMKNPTALEMVGHSLKMMRSGGIYDHLGYGGWIGCEYRPARGTAPGGTPWCRPAWRPPSPRPRGPWGGSPGTRGPRRPWPCASRRGEVSADPVETARLAPTAGTGGWPGAHRANDLLTPSERSCRVPDGSRRSRPHPRADGGAGSDRRAGGSAVARHVQPPRGGARRSDARIPGQEAR